MFPARALAIPLNCQHFLKFLTMQILPLCTKKVKKHIKENLRPVSILPNLSKIFGKCIFKQVS